MTGIDPVGCVQLDVAVRMLLRLLVLQELLPAQLVRLRLPLRLLLLRSSLVDRRQEGSMLRQFLVLQILLVRRVLIILLEVPVGTELLALLRAVLIWLRLLMSYAWPGMIDSMFYHAI